MESEAVRLRPLRLGDESLALAAHRSLKQDNFTFLLDYTEGEAWDDYLERLDAQRRGVDLPVDRVPGTFLAAVVDDHLVGRVSVHHRLNEWLAAYGGHIGYAVDPEHRRKGYAKQILCQSLVVARAVGIDEVLVICDVSNVASVRTIEGCGGKFESVIENPDGGEPQRRYWIP